MLYNGSNGARHIKKISMADQVYDILIENITNQTWAKGEKLPSESELAAQLGVNRLTVRLALQKLNVLGFLDTRVGEGSFVAGTSFSENISEFSKYYMTPDILDDVEEFRDTLELRCLELAVENASGAEIDELEKCCVEFERRQAAFFQNDCEATFTDLLNADFNFHSTLCALSHNKLYVFAFAMAKEPISRYIGLIISERDENKKARMAAAYHATPEDHREVYEAVRRRDAATGREMLRRIINYNS